MSLDFAYLKSHIPIMGDIQQVILAVGWALLLGNLVFQALRSMAAGLGFEGEDPKLLFARIFVFGFLLLASPQICEIVLGMTSKVIALLEVPDAIHVQLVDGSVFGVFTASWLLVIIFDLITMFMVFSLLLEVAERYMVLAMLTVMAPLAFAMGGSKSTSEIFSGWCRMFGSMCFLMATNIVFFKMLLSVVSTVPSFPDVFLWMVLIVSIVKVAKKADEIITRIGLNPAITGGKSTSSSGFTGFHGPQGGGFTGKGTPRGGGSSKEHTHTSSTMAGASSPQSGTAGTAPGLQEGQASGERRRLRSPPRHGRNRARLLHTAGPEAGRRTIETESHTTKQTGGRSHKCIAQKAHLFYPR